MPIPQLEWDEAKRQRTMAARAIDFAELGVLWDGRPFVERRDERHTAEERLVRVGRFVGGRLVVVVWTPRGAAVRIISARKANPREQHEFDPQIPPVWRVGERFHPGGTMPTDWERFDATTDEDIARQIAEDPDTAPEMTLEMMRDAYIVENGVRRPLFDAEGRFTAPPAADDHAPAKRAAGEG